MSDSIFIAPYTPVIDAPAFTQALTYPGRTGGGISDTIHVVKNRIKVSYMRRRLEY